MERSTRRPSTCCRQRLVEGDTRSGRDLEATETSARHEALIDEAHPPAARSAVPTFFHEGRMFWGNDRLPLLEAALRGAELPRWRERG